MKRSGMPRPTSCDLSHDTKLSKDNNVYEDTEPPPGTNILLAPCAISLFLVPRLSDGQLSGMRNFSTVNVLVFFRYSLKS